jgi:ABC-type uncharacterized transport system permease subunit
LNLFGQHDDTARAGRWSSGWRETPMLTFQVIGAVFLFLFFAAMVSRDTVPGR